MSNHQPRHIVYSAVHSGADQRNILRVTGHCAGNSPGIGEFPAQMASNGENVSIWWRHRANIMHRNQKEVTWSRGLICNVLVNVTALQVVITTTLSAANDYQVVNVTTFLLQCEVIPWQPFLHYWKLCDEATGQAVSPYSGQVMRSFCDSLLMGPSVGFVEKWTSESTGNTRGM